MSETNGTPAVADPAAVRDEWVAAVTELVARVEGWCKELDWATRRAPKQMTDRKIGSYEVPMLLMQQWDVRLLLEPVGRFVAGADGRVDLYTMPQYDDLAVLLRRDGEWRVWVELGKEPWDETPLTRDAFVNLTETFARRHAEA